MSYVIVTKDDRKSEEIKQYLIDRIEDTYDSVNPEKIITVGGDGTFLKAMHMYEKILERAVFFIYNTGHLGYFSNYEDGDIDKLIKDVSSSAYKTGSYALMDYRIQTSSGEIKGIALNEVTIINPTRTLMLDVYLDNVMLEHFRGTGICASTPAGSTAYNKSLGGAVVDASLEAFQITEIAPINSKIYHTLASPLVLSKKHEIELKADLASTIWITVDSKSLNIDNFESIAVSLSERKIRYVKNDMSLIKRLTKNFI